MVTLEKNKVNVEGKSQDKLHCTYSPFALCTDYLLFILFSSVLLINGQINKSDHLLKYKSQNSLNESTDKMVFRKMLSA